MYVSTINAILCNVSQGMFARRKSRATAEDNKSENSLVANTGVFEKSLTIEEEKRMAKARR